MSLIGIDIGTSGCKAAAYSLDGHTIAEARRTYEMYRPRPDWAELDPNMVANAAFDALAELVPFCSSDPVTALSVSSMGEAMVPISDRGEVLANAILMVDARGGEYAEDLGSKVGLERFYRINPNVLSPNYSYPKLAWLRDNRPEIYDRTSCFLLIGDFVMYLLGGEQVTSYSLANRTLFFDIRNETWSDELLRLGGIDREKMPMLRASATPSSRMSAAIAQELGFKHPPLLVVGAHDQCCNSLGSGITTAGKASCGIGTVECIAPTYDHIPDEETMRRAGLNIEHHSLPGLYVSFIYNQAGSLITWYAHTLISGSMSGARINEVIVQLNNEMPEDPTDILVLPYFEMTGAPTFEEGGRGSILGLKTTTSRGEIFKAVMECETLYFVNSINTLRSLGIDTSQFMATGGGAKSDKWLQLKSDIFGVPFIRPHITEGGTLGAAILAGLAEGSFSNPDEAVELYVKPERVFMPDSERHEIYAEKAQKYERLAPAVKSILE